MLLQTGFSLLNLNKSVGAAKLPLEMSHSQACDTAFTHTGVTSCAVAI